MKYIILHNIRSAYNVGAIFRSADGAGVNTVYLSGYTPTPTDRFGRNQAEIEKTSLGASTTMKWRQVTDLPAFVIELQSEGVTVAAVEQREDSVSLPEFEVPKQVAYIMGNEVTGVEKEILDIVDVIVELPMLGLKESLNVSVTAGIVLYHQIKKLD